MTTSSLHSRLYMCTPDNFSVEYSINPWMQYNINKTDKEIVTQQWDNLCRVLSSRTKIEVLNSIPTLPDMVFIANAALIIEKKCFIATFKNTERQGESAYWHEYFLKKGFTIEILPSHQYFEGEGDALYDSKRQCIWMGHGKRTEQSVSSTLAHFFDKEVISLELVDDYFYHIDTCFALLPNGDLMYVHDAFSPESIALIEKMVSSEHRIPITREEGVHFTCNLVPADAHTVCCNKASQRIKDILHIRGITIVETPLTEFMKSGGGAKCLVLTEYYC